MMNRSNIPAVFYLLAIAGFLTACGSLNQSDRPAVTSWWLEPYIDSPQVMVSAPLRSVALTVTAVPGLDSDQILTLSDAAVIKPYAGARWVEHLPELMTSLLGRSLEASGRFEMLPDRAGQGTERCDLQLELRKFFADLNSDGRTTGVRIAINGHFQCESAAPVVVQSSVTMPVADERMTVIVAAFQQALDRVTQNILEQL